jgi:DNA mismatch repair protein MutS2
MSYCVGDSVLVIRLGKEGVITHIAGNSRYRVQLANSLNIKCTHKELAPGKSKRKQGGTKRPLSFFKEVTSSKVKQRSVDLHGLTVQVATERTCIALNDALLSGIDVLEVIHGIGQGRLREAVHTLLAETSQVRSFRIKPGNQGTTEVFL